MVVAGIITAFRGNQLIPVLTPWCSEQPNSRPAASFQNNIIELANLRNCAAKMRKASSHQKVQPNTVKGHLLFFCDRSLLQHNSTSVLKKFTSFTCIHLLFTSEFTSKSSSESTLLFCLLESMGRLMLLHTRCLFTD